LIKARNPAKKSGHRCGFRIGADAPLELVQDQDKEIASSVDIVQQELDVCGVDLVCIQELLYCLA